MNVLLDISLLLCPIVCDLHILKLIFFMKRFYFEKEKIFEFFTADDYEHTVVKNVNEIIK